MVVLPREIASSGLAVYHESVLTLVKELKLEGVSADYQQGESDRTWLGHRSVGTVALDFIVGVASGAGWEALRMLLLKRYAAATVKGTVARCTRTSDAVTWEWFEVEGSGTDVADVLARLAPPSTGSEAGN